MKIKYLNGRELVKALKKDTNFIVKSGDVKFVKNPHAVELGKLGGKKKSKKKAKSSKENGKKGGRPKLL